MKAKKFLWVLMACILALSLAAFAACDAGETDQFTVESVSLQETAEIKVGKSVTLTYTVEPEGCTDTVTWRSSDTSIATVSNSGDNAGLVTGVAAGEATITLQVGNLMDTCTVIVTDNGGGTEPEPTVTIQLSQTSATLQVEETVQLTATVSGADASDVAWSVTEGDSYVSLSETTGATVTVTADAAGSAVVTAAVGGVSASCVIRVEEVSAPTYAALASYSVQDNAFTDGETAVSGGTIENGGFKADAVNSVYVDNPYYNETVTSASIVVEFYIANATQTAWSPIIGFKDSGSGFIGLNINDQGQIRLSYNAFDGANNYFDVILGSVAVGNHTVLVSTNADGSVDIYYDSATPVDQIAKGEGVYATDDARQTVGQFLEQAERIYFFGGNWGEFSTAWTWPSSSWGGSFNGSIVSCDFYNGIIPVSEVFGA